MRKLILAIILTFIATAAAFAQTPTQALGSFYKFHRMKTRAFTAEEVDLHRRFFSPELNRLFQYELKREAEFLKQNPTDKPFYGDGFPFLPYEECTVRKSIKPNVLTFAKEMIDGANATVEARFNAHPACGGKRIATFTFKLVKVGEKWLIDDMADGDHKLSEDLNRKEY